MKNIYKIIFIILIIVCLYSLVISANTINGLIIDKNLLEVDRDLYQIRCQDYEIQIIGLQNELDKAKEALKENNYLGEFEITYYCPCEKCCGKNDGITYTGTQATENRTIAVDPEVIPLGSKVIIDGQTYIAEDIGGAIKDLKLDIFVSDHQKALDLGRTVKEVYLV